MTTALLIRGATVVNADREELADVLCVDGRIAAVGAQAAALAPAGAQTLDGSGQYLIPGGIDPHTHMQLPFMGTVTMDDFYTGTAAGLAGGTTSIIDFVIPDPQQPLMDAYRTWRGWAEKSAADYSFHVAITWWGEQVSADMGTLVRDEGREQLQALHGLQKRHHVRRRNAGEQLPPLARTRRHAHRARRERRAGVFAAARSGQDGHHRPRGPPAVAPADGGGRGRQPRHRDCRCAGRAHLRGARELHRIGRGDCPGARARPTCVRRGAGRPPGGGRKCLPPPRFRHRCGARDEPAVSPQGAPGHALARPAVRQPAHHGHRPLHLLRLAKSRRPGQLRQDPERLRRHRRAPGRDLGRGRQHRPPHAQRVRGHHLGQHRQAVQPLPAQGLHHRRRRCRPGALGPGRHKTISVKTQHSKGDFNIFEGRAVRGLPSTTISQGQVVYSNGELRAVQGAGRYLKRPAFGPNFQAVQRRTQTLAPTAVAR